MHRTPDQIRDSLRASDASAIVIEKLPGGGVARTAELADRIARENAENPKYGAKGPAGETVISRQEYDALRAAGAKDATPWA